MFRVGEYIAIQLLRDLWETDSKALRFAEGYSKEQINTVFKGEVTGAWRIKSIK